MKKNLSVGSVNLLSFFANNLENLLGNLLNVQNLYFCEKPAEREKLFKRMLNDIFQIVTDRILVSRLSSLSRDIVSTLNSLLIIPCNFDEMYSESLQSVVIADYLVDVAPPNESVSNLAKY